MDNGSKRFTGGKREATAYTLVCCVLMAGLSLPAVHAQSRTLEETVQHVEELTQSDASAAIVLGEKALAEIPSDRTELRLRLLDQLATANRFVQRYEQAREYTKQLLILAESADNAIYIGHAHRHLGNLALFQSDHEAATAHYAGALESYEGAEHIEGKAMVLGNLGVVHYSLGNYGSALEYLSRAVAINTERQDQSGLIFNWINIGNIRKDVGEKGAALEAYLTAARYCEELDDQRRLASVLNNMGLLYDSMNEYDKAREVWERAYGILVELKDQGRIALALGNLASVDTRQGRYAEAIDKHLQAIEIARNVGHRRTVAFNLRDLGQVHHARDDYSQAISVYEDALTIFREIEGKVDVAITLVRIGESLVSAGQPDEAIAHLNEARLDLEAADARNELVEALEHLAQAYQVTNRYRDAVLALEERNRLNEALHQEQRHTQLERLQTLFEVEQKESQIKSLRDQQYIQDLTLKQNELQLDKQRLLRNALVGALVATLVIGLVMARGYYLRIQTGRELKRLSITDPLTNAYNRRYILLLGEQEMKRAQRYRHEVSIWMMDLDFFKAINDRYGHQVGDEILCSLTALCRQHLRDADIFARWGGEEFLTLLPNSDSGGAALAAGRLQEAIEHTPFQVKGTKHVISITVSIGVASRTGRNIIFEELIKEADDALYAAKQKGRNRVEVFTPAGL